MSEPLVSVIVPTSNRLAFLKQAIASVRTQSFPDWELIVSDNGSTDGTVEWLAEQDDVILLTAPTPTGAAPARNMGIEIARGRLLAFLDDDDIWLPTTLESLIRLDSYERCFAAVGARMRPGRSGRYERLWHPMSLMERDVWQEVLAEWNPTPSQTIFRRDVLVEMGGFPSELWPSDDRAVFARGAMTAPVLLVPEPVCLYRVHPGQTHLTPVLRRRKEILDPIADAMPARHRKKARGLRVAGRLWQDADADLDRRDHMAALRIYMKICRTAPGLLRSPIYRPMLLWKIKRCATGLISR
jgi:glycosyltransferase involved in cell wall biosynthesis